MLLRYQSFYLSLRNEAPITDPKTQRRCTVHVPIGNILTVRSLRTLILSGDVR
jgi:hypothetical protein